VRRLRICSPGWCHVRRGDRHVGHHAVIADIRLRTFGPIEERLFDKQYRVPFGKAREKLLRALPDKSPAQMAENDDAIAIDEFIVADIDFAAGGGFDDARWGSGKLSSRAGNRIAKSLGCRAVSVAVAIPVSRMAIA